MLYRETSTNIFSEIIDYDAKNHSYITYESQPFTSQPLEVGINSNINYMTNELNYSILDDTLYEIEPINDLCYVSSTMSKSDMSFDIGEEPTIQIEFKNYNTPITSSNYGVTLYFNGDYLPNNINVKYYNLNNQEIASYDFTVSSSELFCSNGSLIENYHKILITFIDTKFPYSFIKANNIDYKIIYNWNSDNNNGDSSLLNAKIVEETNILSNTLAINTCEFTVYDKQFNILSTNSIYDYIKRDQKVSIKEIIKTYDNNILQDTYEIFMGDFYIQEWSSNAEHQLFFKCIDLIGIIDRSQFYLGKQYTPQNDTVESVIKSIMSCSSIGSDSIPYNISDELKTKPLQGFLPICSCREALQQVLFCTGAVADCSRSSEIKIYTPDKSIKYNISDNNNLEYEQIKKNDIVSDVYMYKYSLNNGNENVKVFDGNLSKGTHYIKTNELIQYKYQINELISPKIHDGDTNAVILYDDIKYLSCIIIYVISDDYFTITADTYSAKNYLLLKASNNVKIKKEIECKNNYLINNNASLGITYATDKANKLLEYYSRPYTSDTEFIISQYYIQDKNIYISEQTGSWCLIRNKYGNRMIGNINKMEIDLTGGFIAKANLVCIEDIENTYKEYLCTSFYNSENDTSELYSGDNIGLI